MGRMDEDRGERMDKKTQITWTKIVCKTCGEIRLINARAGIINLPSKNIEQMVILTLLNRTCKHKWRFLKASKEDMEVINGKDNTKISP